MALMIGRWQIRKRLRQLLTAPLEVYEVDRIDFAEAYLVASAERSDVRAVVSFDRSIDRVTTVKRIEPPSGSSPPLT